MSREEWHQRFDRAVLLAERVQKDERLPVYVHTLAEAVLWLSETYPDGAPEPDSVPTGQARRVLAAAAEDYCEEHQIPRRRRPRG